MPPRGSIAGQDAGPERGGVSMEFDGRGVVMRLDFALLLRVLRDVSITARDPDARLEDIARIPKRARRRAARAGTRGRRGARRVGPWCVPKELG